MSGELRVSVQADHGIKHQWARGLFYRKDGRKTTLVPRKVLIAGSCGFAVVTILLLIPNGSDDSHPTTKGEAGIQAPSITEAQRIENIPSVGQVTTSMQAANDAAKAKAGEKSEKKRFKGPQLLNRPNAGKIPPGTMVKALLLSGASNGPVRAEIKEDIAINGETLVSEGTILLGTGQSGDDRLSVRFTQMVFKDGSFQSIDAQACDGEDKIAGLKGSKVGSQALKLATGIGLNFAGGMSTALQDTEGQNGAVIEKPTLKNAMLNGAATAALDQSREMMSDMRNKTPAIEVPEGTSVYVLFQGN